MYSIVLQPLQEGCRLDAIVAVRPNGSSRRRQRPSSWGQGVLLSSETVRERVPPSRPHACERTSRAHSTRDRTHSSMQDKQTKLDTHHTRCIDTLGQLSSLASFCSGRLCQDAAVLLLAAIFAGTLRSREGPALLTQSDWAQYSTQW